MYSFPTDGAVSVSSPFSSGSRSLPVDFDPSAVKNATLNSDDISKLNAPRKFAGFGLDLATAGAALKKVPWGKVGLVGAAAAPFVASSGDVGLDALKSGLGVAGFAGGMALGGPLGAAIGSIALPMVGEGVAGLLGAGPEKSQFSNPALEDAVKMARIKNQMELDQARQMAPLITANQREAAQTQMAMQNNLTQNQAYLSAMQGALQLYGMPNLATNQAVAGMFV